MTASFLEGLEEAISKGTPDSRERALWHATDLLMVGRFTDEEVWVFGEVIGRLAAEIELAARAKLAAKLSRIDHAPGQLINNLAADASIEVAGPVLRYSERVDVRTLVNSARTRDQQPSWRSRSGAGCRSRSRMSLWCAETGRSYDLSPAMRARNFQRQASLA